jgi:hypothetical protein
MAIPSYGPQVCLVKFFKLYNSNPIFVRRNNIFYRFAEVLSPQLKLGPQSEITKIIGSINRKSANCHIYGRSAIPNIFLCCGFALCGTWLRTAHLWFKSVKVILFPWPLNIVKTDKLKTINSGVNVLWNLDEMCEMYKLYMHIRG